MKPTSLIVGVVYAICVYARQGPPAGVVPRQRGGGWGGGGGSGGWGSGGSATCEWTDHCLGDPCVTENDCDGQLICRSSKCADLAASQTTTPPTPSIRTSIRTTTVYVTAKPTTPSTPSCEWTDHCLGDPCETENDCDGQLICRSSKCATEVVLPTIITSTRRVTLTSTPLPTRSTAQPQPTTTRVTGPTCGDNPLACIGVSCQTDADCGYDLIICKNGFCGL